jgi:LmbE family N-acetylglucosaminyl deacetylase/CheY-like chemotaxis protein
MFADAVTAIMTPVASVRWAASGEEGLALLPDEDWDLLIADVDLPGINGLELADQAKRVCPYVAVLVLTAHTSLDTAITALRAQADDFLTKPVDPAMLLERSRKLVAAARARRARQRNVVLAIGAHPDDVEIGCGGVLLRHIAGGDRVYVLTLTGGEAGGDTAERAAESACAAELMGVRLYHADLPDTALNVSDGGATIGTIESVIAEVGPTVVYTHSQHDVHQDHRTVHHATLVAARRIPRVYCYQAPSASIDFHPTRFVAIDDYLDRKLEVIAVYASQVAVRGYLQEDMLRATSRYWSRFGASGHVEPLEAIRDVDAIPQDVSADSALISRSSADAHPTNSQSPIGATSDV